MSTRLKLGAWECERPLILAPMAGITDKPFRAICRRLGADLAVGEMVSTRTDLYASRKSRARLDFGGEASPRIVQIAGAEPGMMADAARYHVDHGAEVIDINMGCPAKKVCRKAAGSALLRDEALVAAILAAVTTAVDVPVTLKTRTGWDLDHRNVVRVARIASDLGIAALTIHGRTRACGFKGHAEYATVAEVRTDNGVRSDLSVIVNGDVVGAHSANDALAVSGADGIMVGRAAQGNPWIFRELRAALNALPPPLPPSPAEVVDVMLEHVEGLHAHYGTLAGVRVARKHAGWYARHLPGGETFRRTFNQIDTAKAQLALIKTFQGTIEEVIAA